MLAWQLTRGTFFKQVYTMLKNAYYRDTEKTKESILITVAYGGKEVRFISICKMA